MRNVGLAIGVNKCCWYHDGLGIGGDAGIPKRDRLEQRGALMQRDMWLFDNSFVTDSKGEIFAMDMDLRIVQTALPVEDLKPFDMMRNKFAEGGAVNFSTLRVSR